uniref:Uncharacterized protein n=1 Tax=Romanomermis culicivorax TaxID=13658 RepID=A0A915JP91_ROMCU
MDDKRLKENVHTIVHWNSPLKKQVISSIRSRAIRVKLLHPCQSCEGGQPQGCQNNQCFLTK